MAALADHLNVYSTALIILAEKGYQVWHNKPSHEYWAEKDGWDYVANSPVALLGLIAIYEYHDPTGWSEYWWRAPGYELTPRVPSKPKPYTPIFARKRSTPSE